MELDLQVQNENVPRLDVKDYEILRELDIDFRKSFSEIGKKVNLSKNSVSLRFEKLKYFMLHNLVGLNTEILGYTEVKVYYTFDFFNEDTEKSIISELKKHKNILWAARYYGAYDLGVCFLVGNLEDLIKQVNEFNERFAGKINQKDMQIVCKRFHFRYNFIHKEKINDIYEIEKTNKKILLSNADKKIIHLIRHDPRMSLVEISYKTGMTPKTIASRIKSLEKNKIISGYFMTIDPVKFNHSTFKLLLQVKNLKKPEEFESYLKSIKNVKYIMKMSGLWDYEIDFIYSNVTELQSQLELIKERFPNALKKIAILSFGRRIMTNREIFLN